MKKLLTCGCFLLFALALALPPAYAKPLAASAQTTPEPDLLTLAHSHNDYEHPRPLQDALQQGFHSVEADIWLVEGELLVAHDKGAYKGSLKELYLDPLQELVTQKGSVHGDGKPFLLWIDIKDGSQDLNPALETLLANYPMLTVFTDEKVEEGSVTAILTGDTDSKTRHVKSFSPRRVCRDGGYSKDDPKADNKWTWIAVSWDSLFKWKGEGEIPKKEKEDLVALLADVHVKGRKIRFWGNPDVEAFWKLGVDVGLDLINTDRLEELHEFLANYKPTE